MDRRLLRVDLEGKTALVTGGAKGIGEAISVALAENGADVAVNYLTSEKKAKELVGQFRAKGRKALAIGADVGIVGEAERLVREAQEALGPIDILVNNAGTQVQLSTIEEMSPELWKRVIAINLNGPMFCARQVIPGMKQKGWGRIVNISSISARSGGGPGGAHYSAAKGGMSTLTKALAKELGPAGITVNAIAPGVILTEIHEKFSTRESLKALQQQTPLGRLGKPEDIPGAVLYLVSDSASYVTGETVAVNGGLRMD